MSKLASSFPGATLSRIRWTLASYGSTGHLIRRMHVLSLLKGLITEGNIRNVLDAGCGRGDYVFYLARRFPSLAIQGIDNDPRAYQQCLLKKSYFNLPNTGFRLASLTEPLEDGVYDLGYTVDVLEHIEDNERVIKNMNRCLRAGGRLVIHIPSPQAGNTLPSTRWFERAVDRRAGHVHEGYTLPDLSRRLEEAGFEVEQGYYTFARWRGGLAEELSISLGYLNPITLPFALCLAPLGWLMGYMEIRARASAREGRGTLVVARKKI